MAYGIEMATGGMNYIDSMLCQDPDGKYLCSDYSQFDKTVPPWLIRDAFQIVEDCFDFKRIRRADGTVKW